MPTPEPPIIVSTAPRADSRRWTQRQTDWPGYLDEIHLLDPFDHKECGGLLPAALKNTERTNDEVVARYVATLDADSADLDLPDRLASELPGIRLAWHTTWRHSPANPRYRVHIPFSREVTPAEYRRIANALIRFLGPKSFDRTTSVQPAQFAWRASTSNPAFYEAGQQDGTLLDPDHWLSGPEDDEAPRSLIALEDDDAPPTPAQIDKALTILHKYEREVKTLKDSRTGAPLDGRNVALISRLPTLFRFVLSNCLTAKDVLDSMWYAVQEAPGDHPFTEQEFNTVVARARKYAEQDGPGKPTVLDDFSTLPLPPDASTSTTAAPPQPDVYSVADRLLVAGILPIPARWMPNRSIQYAALTNHLVASLNLAASEYQGSPQQKDFMTFWNGVWREDGTELIRAALAHIFGDLWKPTIEKTVLGLLSAMPGLPTVPIDSPTPHLINLANGMYDINTQTLAPHDSAYLSRNQIPHPLNSDAECPAFDKFLSEVLRPDQIPVMWEVLGYALYPTNPLHRAVLLHGPTGRNGKSTMLHVLSALVGRENHSNIPLAVLADSDFARSALRGRLVNIAGEQEAGRMPTAVVKQLISGDPLSADRKYKERLTFTPHALQVIATNSNITSNDTSEALADRFVIFRFEQTFYGREDPFLLSRLTTPDELQGILVRALTALRDLLARARFDLPTTMLDDRTEYGAAMGGSVKEFSYSYIVDSPGAFLPRTQVLDAYRMSCLMDGVKNPLPRNTFYRALEGDPRFSVSQNSDGTRGYRNLTLVDDLPSEFL